MDDPRKEEKKVQPKRQSSRDLRTALEEMIEAQRRVWEAQKRISRELKEEQ